MFPVIPTAHPCINKNPVIKFTLGNELIEIWYKLVQAIRVRHEAYFFGFQNGVNVSKKRTDLSPVLSSFATYAKTAYLKH